MFVKKNSCPREDQCLLAGELKAKRKQKEREEQEQGEESANANT
jgi:hypothetical protein